MCELKVYSLKGSERKKIMEGAIRLSSHEGKVLVEGILGDSIEVVGALAGIDIIAQEADVIVN
jgi:predicted RNA-binding protein